MARKSRRLVSAREVIETIGPKAFQSLISSDVHPRKKQHISNYKSVGRLPPDTFLIVMQELLRHGYTADPAIWAIDAPSPMQIRLVLKGAA